jgi:hypothetical protein
VGGLWSRNRTVYLETPADRKQRKLDDQEVSEEMPDFSPEPKEPEGLETLPEYASVEEFVTFCMDDERNTYTSEELRCVSHNMRRTTEKVRAELTSYGLTLKGTPKEKVTRGILSNSHNLYQGNPMSGGSGVSSNGGGARYGRSAA